MKTNLSCVLPLLLAACTNTQTDEDLFGADTGDSQPAPWEDWDLDTGEPGQEESGDRARIVTFEFPTRLGCEESGYGVVLVENIGTTTWTRADGFKLGAVNDEDPLFDSGDVRVWLDEGVVVNPGDQHRFGIDLRGTGREGVETTDWQMVHEGVRWFGQIASAEVNVSCSGDAPNSCSRLPLPDMSHVVDQLASESPGLLSGSCLADGGSWGFLDELVDRLRQVDDRWGYNWKRGVEGDASQDVVDYHHGAGDREGSPEVYIVDVIVGHCGDSPAPGWMDQTQATADAGTIGRWTSRGQF